MKDNFLSGELFEQTQLQNVFPDGKTFVDCTARSEPSIIERKYQEQKVQRGFNLAAFIHEHFILPKTYVANYESVKGRPIIVHIQFLWDELTRQTEGVGNSLIPLPYPYIVPGGRFREFFYWDSYFTMLGLQVSGRIDMIRNMVNNFSYLIDRFGYIPNGNRTYFLGRSQPPFFASMVTLLEECIQLNGHGESILVDYLPQLEKEYSFWMRGEDQLNENKISMNRVALMPDGSLLNHYWDDNDTPRPESYKEDVGLSRNIENKENLYRNIRAACESGWDFSSRWLKDVKDPTSIHTTEIIAVDLNCLLFHLEQTIAYGHELSNNYAVSKRFVMAADKRRKAINKYCWNESENFYYDYDYSSQKQKRSMTLASTFPLFFKIASNEQAKNVSIFLRNHFLFPAGLRTTTESSGEQWDSPNGWAPLHWIAIRGLINYGYDEFGKEIARRWLDINDKVYNETGKMMEKYNVVIPQLKAGGGEYQSQDGFGWTNGVYLALHKVLSTG